VILPDGVDVRADVGGVDDQRSGGGDAAAREAGWHAAQARVKRQKYLTMGVAAVVLPAVSLPAVLMARVTSTGGPASYPVIGAWAFVFLLPLIYLIFRISVSQQGKTDQMIAELARQLTDAVAAADRQVDHQQVQVRRQAFERRLSNALDMAAGEPEVIDVIERSFTATLPGSPVELLLADNSHAHLLRMASTSPTGKPPGCGVDSPDHCPAARRAQVQRFADSGDLDACPKLRNRPDGAVSALCVPVSIMGRTVGVIHATGEPGAAVTEDGAADLGTLANLAGARIGLLRVMAETQLQAATDSLTGLLNRRSFEQQVSVVRRQKHNLAVGMSDLDHFKILNDTHGHDTGDRALRLFAQIITDSLRVQDLACRHGGEEFVIALPGCTSDKARDIFDVVRAKLDAAITVAGLPRFTASFGVVDAADKEDLSSIISRSDAALFQAKRDGRNQIVVHDAGGEPVIPTAAPRTITIA
jgi:diguanylate cyclase (GGDEF)-like protein